MKSLRTLFFNFFVAALATTMFVSCDSDEGSDPDPGITITSIDPLTAREGDIVTINGTGFSTVASENVVRFNSSPSAEAQVMTAAATQLTVKVPTGVGQVNGPIQVKVGDKSAVSTQSFTLDTSIGSPRLISISTGSALPGTEITITGENFSTEESELKVFFGTKEITAIAQSTLTSIKVTVPQLDDYPAAGVPVKVKRGTIESSNTLTFIVLKPLPKLADIIWGSTGGVFKTNSEGTVELYVDQVGGIRGIAVNQATGDFYFLENGGKRILKGSLDGTAPLVEVYTAADGVNSPYDIAIDPATGALYYTDLSGKLIVKGSMDGTAALVTLYDATAGLSQPLGVKLHVANNTLYWTNGSGKNVYKGSTDGSTAPVELFNVDDGLTTPRNIAVDPAAGKIYISETIGSGATLVSRIVVGNITGDGALTTLFDTGDNISGQVNDIEIDTANGYIYWLNFEPTGEIMRGTLDGATNEKVFDIAGGNLFDIRFTL